MSEILNMARDFESKSKRLADDTMQSVQSALIQHEERLLKALEQSASTTEAAIRDQNLRLSKLALKGWLWVVLTLALFGAMSWGILWWTGEQIASNISEIQHQHQTLTEIASKGGQIHLNQCGQNQMLCVAVDPSTTFSGNDGRTYMMTR